MSAFAAGAGLMLAGGLFGASGAQKKRRALMQFGATIMKGYRDVGNEYMGDITREVEGYRADRDRNISMYQEQMGTALSSYERLFTSAREDYAAGMDRSLGEYRTGRDSTIAMMRKQSEGAQRKTIARNAFTGLGQTSFGQNQVTQVGAEGDLREGVVREQYAQGLSSLEAQRAAGVSQMGAQYAAGVSGIQQSMATNSSNIYQGYTNQAAGYMMQGQANRYQMIQQGMNQGYALQSQSQAMAGSGSMMAGSMMGSFGGALFGMGAGGFGGGGGGGGATSPMQTGSSNGIIGSGGNWSVTQGIQGFPRF